jgi:hypothetical protein
MALVIVYGAVDTKLFIVNNLLFVFECISPLGYLLAGLGDRNIFMEMISIAMRQNMKTEIV